MAYSVHFPSAGPAPSIDAVAEWLTDRGEPFDRDGPETLGLRAVPVRLVVARDERRMRADLDVNPSVRLDRVVGLLFDLALEAGADVRLSDTGTLTRGQLWLRLADEQDRLRLADGLRRADELGKREAISRALWGVLAALLPDRDVRWDANRERIVELLEVGGEGGLSIEEAAWHAEDPAEGDVIAVPIDHGSAHVVAWRWFAESHPSLAGG